MNNILRIRFWTIFVIGVILGFNSACAAGATPTIVSPTVAAPVPTQTTTGGLQVILAASRLDIGPNRFPLGIIRDTVSVKAAQVHLKFYDLSAGTPALSGEADAPFYGDNLGEAGVYVAQTTFDKAGSWGVEVAVNEPGHAPEIKRVGFNVLLQDPVPKVGDLAPKSKNLTLQDVNGDRSKISSSTVDDSILHKISIAEAVTNGKPTVILFATPKFCTSRTCGPSHQVILSLAPNYADRVNFIHVEVYKDFTTFEPADAMREWNFDTEPWLFFVDAHGKIAARFEGGITTKEIVPAFLKFIGQ